MNDKLEDELSSFLWYEVRDPIAEGVPGEANLDPVEVAELCCALAERFGQLEGQCTRKDLDAVKSEYLRQVEAERVARIRGEALTKNAR